MGDLPKDKQREFLDELFSRATTTFEVMRITCAASLKRTAYQLDGNVMEEVNPVLNTALCMAYAHGFIEGINRESPKDMEEMKEVIDHLAETQHKDDDYKAKFSTILGGIYQGLRIFGVCHKYALKAVVHAADLDHGNIESFSMSPLDNDVPSHVIIIGNALGALKSPEDKSKFPRESLN